MGRVWCGWVVWWLRRSLLVVLAGAVLSGVLVGVAPVPPAGADAGDVCDSTGDGVDDGVERLVVSDGEDANADVLSEELGLELGPVDDPDRWFVSICEGASGWGLLDGPDRGLSPDASSWESDALLLALEEIEGVVPRPGFRIWPNHLHFQTVNLETWLTVLSDSYDRMSFEGSGEVNGVLVDAVAGLLGAEFRFSDGVTVFCPVEANAWYDSSRLPDVPCGRDWERPSATGVVTLAVVLRYEVTWVSSLGNVSPAPLVRTGDPRAVVDLTVAEVQSYLSEDGIEIPYLPNPEEIPTDDRSSDECFHFGFVPKPECIPKLIFEEIYERLPEPVREVIDAVIDFFEGCIGYGVDAVGDVVASVGEIVDLARDPKAFIEGKWQTAQDLYSAIVADPQGFIAEMGTEIAEEELRLDLIRDGEYAQWAGYMGCKIAVAVLTGGAATAKLVEKAYDFLNSRFPDVVPPRRKPGDDDDDGSCQIGGGRSCGCNSFPTGTEVVMADGGLVPIEDIEPGDVVLAADPVTGEWTGREVLDQWSHVDHGQMVTATLVDGSSVSATDHHLFWVDNQGAWVELEDVQPGDHLLTPDGVATVAHVIETAPKTTLVWELDTATDNTFTVTTGTEWVLVHNANRNRDGCFTAPTKPQNYSGREWEEILPGGKPPTAGPDFERWWKSLSAEERKYLSRNTDLFSELRDLANGNAEHLVSLARSHPGVGRGATAGGATGTIGGLTVNYLSRSGNPSIDGFVPTPRDPIFPTASPTDAEYKILEFVAELLDSNRSPRPGEGATIEDVSGTLEILVDSPPGRVCEHCRDVVDMFEERYPNVTLTVRDIRESP